MGSGGTLTRSGALIALLAALAHGDANANEDASTPVVVALSWAPAESLAAPPRALDLTDTSPTGVVAPLHAEGVQFAAVAIGDSTLAIAVDLRDGSERIWMDHDLDGDLGDDARAWWAHGSDGWTRREYVPVFHAESRERAYLPVRVRCDPSRTRVELFHTLCRAGSGVIGGRVRDVVLLDTDHDARFDGPSDRVLVDLDGDGHLDSVRETIRPGRAFRVAGQGWVAEAPTSSGAQLVVRPSAAVPKLPDRVWVDVAPPPAGVTPALPPETLDELLTQLAARPTPSARERLDLVARIGRIGTDAAFAALEQRVHTDRAGSVRAAAARAMGNPLFREAHVETVVAFTDVKTLGDPARCVAAIEALHAMDWPERGALYRRLVEERSWLVAGAAARHLAYLPNDAARAVAIDGCTSLSTKGSQRASWHDRLDAYCGVRTIPGGPSPELMVAMAQSSHPALIALALDDLRSIGHPDTQALARRASRFTQLIWNPPDTRTDPTDMSPYTWQLIDGRRALGTVLIRILGSGDDADSMEGLLRVVRNAPQHHRDALRRQLAARRSVESVAAVIRGLSAHDVLVREVAAEALGGVPGAAVTRALLSRVDEERNERVLFAVLGALRERADPDAAAALLPHCEDGTFRGFALRAAAASAPRDPRVRRVVLEHLRSEEWEQRVRGALAARESRDVAFAPHVVELIVDERWSVRVAAIETLRQLRTRDSALPLIDGLANEARLRLRLAIADALFALTGADLGPDVKPWRAWHADHGASFEVPEHMPVRRPAVASTTAAFFGLPVDSDHATFVLDRSGSMRAPLEGPAGLSRLHASMDETAGAVRGMPDAALVNLVLFHMSPRPWKNRLVPLNERNRIAFGRRVRSALLGPQTDVFRALRTALRDPESDTIMLLTDGLPNTGDHVEPADLLQVIARLNETSQVAIHCVSLGTDAELLRRLAAENAGRHVRR